MSEGHLYSISEAARLLGKPNNRKLLRSLIRHHGITTRRVGRDTALDEEGFQTLKTAVEKWDGRPRINSLARATA